ncbi:MAG: hypothetical protein HQM03_16110 [Magnetococcales bacterium]|nr:hypothetical protein [Magnetococcales bacterium]
MKVSMRVSLWFVSVGLVVVISSVLGGLTYWAAKEVLRDNLRTRIGNIVAVAALRIDPELHKRIRTRDDENGQDYQTLKRQLRQIRDISKEIRFLYTSRLDHRGQVLFVVDAEESEAELSHVGDVYEEATPLMRQLFAVPRPFAVEEEFTTDKWGTFLSGYAPFHDKDGKLEGLVGMDLTAEQVMAYEQQHLNVILYVVAFFTLIGMWLGSVLSRLIAQSLGLLEQDMARIQTFDLDAETVTGSRIVELNRMQEAVHDMKKSLRSFKKYVPADLVAELIQLRQEAVLGAESRGITLFFSDIAGFTTIAERLAPNELSQRLGIYFEAMTRTILQQHGTVDKFIGDAVMAFWGAPKPHEDHALLACRAAVRCQRALREIAEQWTAQGMPPFATRIGICTGDALVGNMGYSERLSYTALGDVVNLASRLEGLNKFFGTRIVIGESTHALVQAEMATRCLGVVAVKGKTRGVRIHELVEEKALLAPENLLFLERFDLAMERYLARDWNAALVLFQECLERVPGDHPSSMMITQCRNLLDTPPGDDWNGVMIMQDK